MQTDKRADKKDLLSENHQSAQGFSVRGSKKSRSNLQECHEGMVCKNSSLLLPDPFFLTRTEGA